MHKTTIVLAALIFTVAAARAPMPTEEFARETAAAVSRMMGAMEVRPSGDVDRDFAAMMIPHHEGAIQMAVAELRYGSNPQLKRIAQEIIVDQQQEIAAMKLAIGDQLPAPHPVPTRPRDFEPPREH